MSWRAYAGVVLIAASIVIIAYVLVPRQPSVITEALGWLADEYRYEALRPPRADLELGSTLRRDGLVLTQGCFEGAALSTRVLEPKQYTYDFSRQATGAAKVQQWLGLNSTSSRVGRVEMALSGIAEEAIVNVRPTFSPGCLEDGEIPDDPVVAATLRVDEISIHLVARDGRRIGGEADAREIVEEIDANFSGGYEERGSGTWVLSGAGLIVGVKTLDPSFEREVERFRVGCAALGEPSEKLKWRGQLTVCDSGGSESPAQLRLVNSFLGSQAVVWEGEVQVGGAVSIYDEDGTHDSLLLESVNANGAIIEVVRVRWGLEAGTDLEHAPPPPAPSGSGH